MPETGSKSEDLGQPTHTNDQQSVLPDIQRVISGELEPETFAARLDLEQAALNTELQTIQQQLFETQTELRTTQLQLGATKLQLQMTTEEKIGLQAENKTYKRLSKIDAKTELKNAGAFEEELDAYITDAIRKGYPISILMCDIDKFKLVNDTYGHPAGDLVLLEVARTLKSSLRNVVDEAYRCGGEEFSALLPITTVEGSLEVAQRVLNNIRNLQITLDDGKVISVTLSIGVAGYNSLAELTKKLRKMKPKEAKNFITELRKELINQADQAMYQAKEFGRDQVVEAPPIKLPL